ncbi:MAG: hypothetical protein WC714_03525 [Candidatus Obscuribacterales bacterium]
MDDWSKSISQTIGNEVNVVNLAWHAGMIADCNKTIKAYMHSQKTPRIVLLMIAPREFSDNFTAQTGVLAGYSLEPNNLNILEKFQKSKSVESLPLVLAETILPGKLLNQLISNSEGSCSQAINTVIAYYSETFKKHKIACDKMVVFCAKLFQRPENLGASVNYTGTSAAAHSVKTVDFSPFERDIAMYRQRYNPTNAKCVKKAEIALTELQETCAANAIYLIIMNMPLTRENRALIPPHTYTIFVDKLSSVTARPNCLMVDASKNSNFSRADFHDSVHLNRSGKEKLRRMIIPILTAKLTDQKKETIQPKPNTAPPTVPSNNIPTGQLQ